MIGFNLPFGQVSNIVVIILNYFLFSFSLAFWLNITLQSYSPNLTQTCWPRHHGVFTAAACNHIMIHWLFLVVSLEYNDFSHWPNQTKYPVSSVPVSFLNVTTHLNILCSRLNKQKRFATYCFGVFSCLNWRVLKLYQALLSVNKSKAHKNNKYTIVTVIICYIILAALEIIVAEDTKSCFCNVVCNRLRLKIKCNRTFY